MRKCLVPGYCILLIIVNLVCLTVNVAKADTLTCTVGTGVGAVTALPGIVQTPRYDGAKIVVDLETGNLRVSGPLDKDIDYQANGYRTKVEAFEGKWVITAQGPTEDFVREHIVITAAGAMFWTSISYATILNAAAASLYVGRCH